MDLSIYLYVCLFVCLLVVVVDLWQTAYNEICVLMLLLLCVVCSCCSCCVIHPFKLKFVCARSKAVSCVCVLERVGNISVCVCVWILRGKKESCCCCCVLPEFPLSALSECALNKLLLPPPPRTTQR